MLGMTAAWKLVKCIFTVWRFKQMVKHTMNVAKGIGMGVLAGVAVAAVSSKVMNGGHKKASHMRKSAGKAMHSMGALIGDVEKCSADRLRRDKPRRRPPAAGPQEGPKLCGPRPRLGGSISPEAAGQDAQAASSRRAPGRSQAVRPAPTPWGKHLPRGGAPIF